MQNPDNQNRGTPLPCLFTPGEVAAGDAERIARLDPARQPTLSDILKASARLASMAPPEPPARPSGGPTLSVILGDPARPANDIERDRIRSMRLETAATAASLSPGLVRVLLLGLEDMGYGVPMWALSGITFRSLGWCQHMSRTLSRWGLVTYDLPAGGTDEMDWRIRLTPSGRAVARHIMSIESQYRHV
ncbi:conserved protein of unknown function [Methylorubrum extorquens]|uniref:Uncharacterized protein n=1 Tax=Methylorubrum extorquens TaxID=408 RepID=A0A2N9ATL9_METEX|nr:conserved protein of unknown function [Methylorubrum extorquens]